MICIFNLSRLKTGKGEDGDVLFDDYKSFLEELNFSLVEVMSYGGFGDALFINNDFKKILEKF